MKKKNVRKNQVIIAALAVMIVAAGYLNFKSGGMNAEDSSPVSGTLSEEGMTAADEVLLDLNENEVQEIEVADEEDMEDLVDMTNRSEMEVAAENLLTAKGFENSVVSLTKDSCDVVVCRESLTEGERAQIEDIICRKTDIGTENVVITTLN